MACGCLARQSGVRIAGEEWLRVAVASGERAIAIVGLCSQSRPLNQGPVNRPTGGQCISSARDHSIRLAIIEWQFVKQPIRSGRALWSCGGHCWGTIINFPFPRCCVEERESKAGKCAASLAVVACRRLAVITDSEHVATLWMDINCFPD